LLTFLQARRVRVVTFEEYLRVLASNDGSDLYLSTGAPPCAKFQGIAEAPRHRADASRARSPRSPTPSSTTSSVQQFAQELEMNLAVSDPSGAGRFRINIFRQRNEVSIVARNITTDIPKLRRPRACRRC
jgi:twitching motility protein PilU